MLRIGLTAPNFDSILSGVESEMGAIVTAAMRDTTDEVKEAFRAQVRGTGLGDRLANAVRGVTYPHSRNSLQPAGWVYAQPSKDGRGAAAIIDSYANGAIIVPRGGKRYLAIPTDDVPRTRQGAALTPEQVEARFGRRLVPITPDDRGFNTPSTRHRGVMFLVMKSLVVRKATGRWRNASERERAGKTRNPRPVQSIIMFTLVPHVKKPKSIDLAAPEALAAQRFDANLSARWR